MKASVVATALLLGHGLPSPAAAQEPKGPGATLLNPLSAIDPAKLDGFLGRPLFSSTRRPPPAMPSEPLATLTAKAPADPPAVRLVGIVRTPKESIAQVIQGNSEERLSVRVGDFLGDWIITAIEASTITLALGERNARLDIFREPDAGGHDVQDAEVSSTKRHSPAADKRAWSKEEVEGFFGPQD